MRFLRAAAWLTLLAVMLTACSSLPRPSADPTPDSNPPAGNHREPEPDPRHNPPAVPDPDKDTEPSRPPAAPKPAVVTVEQEAGHSWRAVTVLEGYAPPGPATVRLSFSKPVRQAEVEQALRESQASPVRGLMQWVDEQTLIWQIAELPPRLDFLLGSARDQDGVPLPGGIPSLRVGGPPSLVTLDLTTGEETAVVALPPDIQSAALSADGTHLNLLVWRPGGTQWDWQPAQLAVDLTTGELQSGWVEGAPPRLAAGLEQWALNPAETVVAGVRGTDLVIMDMRGGRQQVIPGFIVRMGQQPPYLAWAPTGDRVAALSHKGDGLSDLVAAALPAGPAAVLAADVPVPAGGTHLAWSPDGRFVLAGRLLIDLQDGTYRPVEGVADQAEGAWEPNGARLVLSAGDWGPMLLVEPASGDLQALGEGLAAGWAGPGRVYLVRWPAAGTRYVPPGL